MLRTSFVVGALLLSSCAQAFYDTVPVATWTSAPSSAIESLKDHVAHVPSQAEIVNAMLNTNELCSLDTILVVAQPGLHASHLSSLSSDSHLKSRIQSASSKAHFPYVPVSGTVDAGSLASDIAALCQATATKWSPGQAAPGSGKHVLHLELPEVADRFWSRYDETLEETLAEIASQFPAYGVFLTGTASLDLDLLAKRQQPNSLSSPGFINHPTAAFANFTTPTGGILARYQLLTPGLLTSLLIAFGLLIPLLMVGIQALASIRNPIRTEFPKGPSLEKKNQ